MCRVLVGNTVLTIIRKPAFALSQNKLFLRICAAKTMLVRNTDPEKISRGFNAIDIGLLVVGNNGYSLSKKIRDHI